MVVGIDVSHAAVGAALWAVDEAISRDIPLRLLYAIDQTAGADTDPQDATHQLATAEQAVRHASTAVESTGKPVKIEVEILRSRPTRALMDASRSTALVCINAIGLNHFAEGRVGSTAASLAAVAQCPVAIIRWRDTAASSTPGWIVVEVDESRDPTALQLGLDEARLRGAPVRVVATWQSRFTDIHDARAVTDGNRAARAQLDRRLAYWGRRYPDIDLTSMVVNGNIVNYLAKNAGTIQLVVVGRATGATSMNSSDRPALRLCTTPHAQYWSATHKRCEFDVDAALEVVAGWAARDVRRGPRQPHGAPLGTRVDPGDPPWTAAPPLGGP
ncbi:MAG: universal stress protein [Mycobacterium sp.]